MVIVLYYLYLTCTIKYINFLIIFVYNASLKQENLGFSTIVFPGY